jgi:hypothetical protein
MSWRRIGAALLVVSGALVFWLYLHRDQVSQSTFDRIDLDMPVKEVHALLGRRPDRQGHLREFDEADSEVRSFQEWNASELTIVVMFDANGRVVDRYRYEPEGQPWYLRLLQTAKRSFGLQ